MSEDKSLGDIILENKKQKQDSGNKKFAGRGGNQRGKSNRSQDKSGPRRQNAQNGNRPNNRYIKRTGTDSRKIVQSQRQPAKQEEGKGRVVRIFNLDPSITDEQLYELVSEYGHVEFCRIKREVDGKSKREATVVYRNPENADTAKKEMNGNSLQDKVLNVEIYKYSDAAHELNDRIPDSHSGNQVNRIQRRGLFKRNDDRDRKFSGNNNNNNQRRGGNFRGNRFNNNNNRRFRDNSNNNNGNNNRFRTNNRNFRNRN